MKKRMVLSTAEHPDLLKPKFRAAVNRCQMLGLPSVHPDLVPWGAIAEKMLKPVEQGRATRLKPPEYHPAEFVLIGGVLEETFEAELRCEIDGAYLTLMQHQEEEPDPDNLAPGEELKQRSVTLEFPEGTALSIDAIRAALDQAGIAPQDRPSEEVILEAMTMAAQAVRNPEPRPTNDHDHNHNLNHGHDLTGAQDRTD